LPVIRTAAAVRQPTSISTSKCRKHDLRRCKRELLSWFRFPKEGKGREIVITEEVRLGFIHKAREEIGRKKIDYEREFIQTGKIAFEQATAQYRKCKEICGL
jgi:hypothetical protein